MFLPGCRYLKFLVRFDIKQRMWECVLLFFPPLSGGRLLMTSCTVCVWVCVKAAMDCCGLWLYLLLCTFLWLDLSPGDVCHECLGWVGVTLSVFRFITNFTTFWNHMHPHCSSIGICSNSHKEEKHIVPSCLNLMCIRFVACGAATNSLMWLYQNQTLKHACQTLIEQICASEASSWGH